MKIRTAVVNILRPIRHFADDIFKTCWMKNVALCLFPLKFVPKSPIATNKSVVHKVLTPTYSHVFLERNLYILIYMIYIDWYIWYIYIYYPLYTNWPITNADLPHVIIQYIPYFIYQKLYWTVSGQLSNIGYIGQFQNEATGTLRTRFRRTKAVSMHLMKILSIFLHLRKTLICFRIGWFL